MYLWQFFYIFIKYSQLIVHTKQYQLLRITRMPKAPTREIVLGAQQKEIAAQLHHHRGADQYDFDPDYNSYGSRRPPICQAPTRKRSSQSACGQGGIRRVAPRTAAKLRGQQRGRGQVDSCQVQQLLLLVNFLAIQE